MTPDDIINEELENEEEEQEEDQEPETNIIDLNNYGMKPYSWRYEGEGGGGGGGGQGGGGVLVVTVDPETNTMDKTWAEIKDAVLDGVVSLVVSDALTGSIAVGNICELGTNGSIYGVITYGINSTNGSVFLQAFMTDSEDGYPVLQNQG